jgi:hypothetical protein
MVNHDIVRITLNAKPENLDDKEIEEKRNPEQIREKRIEKLREKIRDHMPEETNEKNMSDTEYPIYLLACLKSAAIQALTPSEYQKKRLFPLFSTVYADGHQMVTLTAIILDDLDNNEKEVKIRKCLAKHSDYVNFEWDEPCPIKIPALTTKEIIHINGLLPDSRSVDKIKKNFDFAFQNDYDLDDTIKSYMNYYKYYPNFHHVNL